MYIVTASARFRIGSSPVRTMWARLVPSLLLPVAATLLRYQTWPQVVGPAGFQHILATAIPRYPLGLIQYSPQLLPLMVGLAVILEEVSSAHVIILTGTSQS